MPDRLPAGITALIADATTALAARDAVIKALYDWLRGEISGDRLVEIAVHHRAVIEAGDQDPCGDWPEYGLEGAGRAPVAGSDFLPPVTARPTNAGRHEDTSGAVNAQGRAIGVAA
jgi:hypothetical protein